MLAAIEQRGPTEIVGLAQSLISFFVRWSVISRLESTLLEEQVFALAPEISNGLALEDARQRLRDAAPTDEQFRDAFAIASLSRPGYRRHVLVRLEMMLREQAQQDEVEPRPAHLLHVEHIYPQTPASPADEWEGHDDWVDRIGNLTLLHRRWNTAIRNGDFATVKIPALRQSVILLNESVINRTAWNKEAIAERQARLTPLAPPVWPL